MTFGAIRPQHDRIFSKFLGRADVGFIPIVIKLFF